MQTVMCLSADPGVASSMLAWSHTFAEIDHEIISTVILLLSADSRRVVNIFTDRSKAVLLLWIICVIYGLCVSCFRICSLLPCGHLKRMG